MKSITLETIYKKVINLQRDVTQIKKNLMEEPELREDLSLSILFSVAGKLPLVLALNMNL